MACCAVDCTNRALKESVFHFFRMICRILLLITLTCCVCGTFVVNVTQSSYQAEENKDVTLEWTFTTTSHTSTNSISIYCYMDSDHGSSVLFSLKEGAEDSESQDEKFAGRVQCDKDVLKEGRIRLHLSRLHINDSGLYVCEVSTSYGVNYNECRLNVTAARNQPEPERPKTGRWKEIALYCSLAVTASVGLVGCYCLYVRCRPRRLVSFMYSLCGGSQPSSQSGVGLKNGYSPANDQKPQCDQKCELVSVTTESGITERENALS